MYAAPPPSRYGYVTPPTPPPPRPYKKRKDHAKAIIIAACIILSPVVVSILWGLAHPPSAAELKQIEAQREEQEKQEKVRQAKQKEYDDMEHVAIAGARALKDSMRNPASFKLIKAIAMPTGAYCYSYRAQNGFGGMDVGFTVITPKGDFTQNTSAYNHYCNGSGWDMTEISARVVSD